MTDTAQWTEEAINAWYLDIEDTEVPATHIVTVEAVARIPVVIPPWQADKADAIAAELAAAWQDNFRDEGLDWEWVEDGHPARDCVSGKERGQLDLGVISIEEVS